MTEADPVPRGRLLVVCRANVCRSPTLALLLGRLLPGELDIVTAGWRVDPRLPWCPEMRRLVPDGPDAAALAVGHRPTLLDAAAIEAADLVLTADQRARAETAKVAPAFATRLFTAVEASHLLAAVARDAPTATAHLAELADRMDAVRGTVELPVARTTRWSRHLRAGIDLPDPHSVSRGVRHDRVKPLVEQAAASLAAGLTVAG
jgi:protein-tyrosine-phosphatase